MKGFHMSKFSLFVKKFLGGFVKKLYRIRIIGAENEPENGPFIVCSNHISNHDVVVLFVSMKSRMRFLAKAELFKIPVLNWIVKAFGAYPIKRGGADVSALKNTISMLKEGQVVCYFPQGHRFPGVDPSETPVQHGVGLVARKSEVPVLPVLISTKNNKVRMFRKTTVTIGKPIYFSEFGEMENNKNDYVKISGEIFERICSLQSSFQPRLTKPATEENKQKD